MDEATKEQLEGLVRKALLDLWAAYDLQAVEIDTASVDTELAAMLPFGGNDAEGSLLLRCSQGFLAHMGYATREAAIDWLGELANQALGRTKAILLRHGVEIVLATPVLYLGRQLTMSSRMLAKFPYSHTFVFQLGEDTCIASFMMSPTPCFSLGDERDDLGGLEPEAVLLF